MSVAEQKGRMLVALLQILSDESEGLQGKEAIERVRDKVELIPQEEGVFDQTGLEKFPQLVRFATIPAVKAGWLVKSDGIWSITAAGEQALAEFPEPEPLYKEAWNRYKEWKAGAAVDVDDEANEAEVGEAVSLEEPEDSAREEILEYIAKMLPFDFQRACAALVGALGHEVRWISEPGPDGGLDFVAYADPIGVEGRRIKGQAKRHKNKQHVDDVKAFLSNLKNDDVGLFIALGGFTKPAEDAVRQDERRLILLDGPDFVRLWIDRYEHLAQEDRALLRVKPVWHLIRSGE